MKVSGEDLTFEADEAHELLLVVSKYVPSVRDQSPGVDTEELDELWSRVGDFAHYQILSDIWSLKSTEKLPFGVYAEASDGSLGRPPSISEDETDRITFPNSRGLLSTAMTWASINLVQGSLVLQNATGHLLNSSFEDHPISHGLGSTNDSLARRHAESMTGAGRKAAEWLIQLDLET